MVRVGMKINVPRGLYNRLSRAEVTMPGMISDALLAAATVARGEIAQRAPINTGALRSSIVASVRGGFRPAGIVATPLAYAPAMESGRKKGARKPPIGPIALWAQRVLGLTEEEALVAANAIAWKIHYRGIDPHWFFRDGTKAARSQITALFRVLARRVLRG